METEFGYNPNITIEERDASEGPPTNLPPIMLLWTDPPYGTGKTQKQGNSQYYDPADTTNTCETIKKWLPAMDPNGTVVICCDYRLAPHITQTLINAEWCYRGEIIWEFGLGRPRTTWWPVRHNNLLTFTQTETSGIFNPDAVPRQKRLAPKPGYPDDKPAGSTWNYTMSNTDPQRVSYPNQKPTQIIDPFIQAHTNPGDLVADPYSGSGSTAASALANKRNFYGCDINPQSIQTISQRIRNTTERPQWNQSTTSSPD